MFVEKQKSDISLFLPINDDVQNRRSCWRWWKQLSRLQRNFVYSFIVIASLYFLFHRGLLDVRKHEQKAELSQSDGESVVRGNDINKFNEKHQYPEENALKNDDANNIDAVQPDLLHKDKVEEQKSKSVVFEGPTNERQQAVVDAFKFAWNGYKKYAWGHDHLRPMSGGYHDWFSLGLTLVDGMDTAYMMGLNDEYEEARNWVKTKLNFEVNKDVNLFEVTIRVLGSLLSNYHLTGDEMFLNKAIDLGERLLPAFETPSGIPFSDVNLATRQAHAPKWSPDSSTSEVTTLQLEFRDLARSSYDSRFENAVAKVSQHVHSLEKMKGLVPIFISPNSGQFLSYSTITLGARGDSYYEYLLKQWLQTGKTIDYLRDDYVTAVNGIQEYLVRKTSPNGYVFLGELIQSGKTQREMKPKMDHLTCYLPGTLALGVKNGMPSWHMKLAEDLMSTCYQTYAIQPTFLAPEITYFNMQTGSANDMYVKSNDAHNLLRPEFLESLWYMYQLTGNTTYQNWGWKIFQAFDKYTKVEHGYTSIGSVLNTENTRPRDIMESFFLGETLKYCYLLFSDNRYLLDLNKYVLNSEAHPLPIRDV